MGRMRNIFYPRCIGHVDHLVLRAEKFADQPLHAANGGNFSNTAQALVISLSGAIRKEKHTTNVTNGSVRYTTTIIRINWKWVIYQLFTVFLSIVFLVMTTLFSREKNGLVWKSSSLAVLFHALDGWREDYIKIRTTDDMARSAIQMWTRLQENDNGQLKLKRE